MATCRQRLCCVPNTGHREMFCRGFLHQRRAKSSSPDQGSVREADQEQDSRPGGSPLSAVQDEPKPGVGPQPAWWVWLTTCMCRFHWNHLYPWWIQIVTVTWSLTRGLCGTWALWPPASSWWTNQRKTRCTTWLKWPISHSWLVILSTLIHYSSPETLWSKGLTLKDHRSSP